MSTGANPSGVYDSNMNRVAVKLFFGITEEWGLTVEQCCILAGIDTQTALKDWRQKLDSNEPVNLPPNTLERLSYLAGIYKGLQVLFPDPEQRKAWIRKPNKDFGGISALDRLMAGRAIDLKELRRYLDCWSGEHYG